MQRGGGITLSQSQDINSDSAAPRENAEAPRLPEFLAKRWNDLSDSLTAIYQKQEEEPFSKKLESLQARVKDVQAQPESKELAAMRQDEAKLSQKYLTAPEKAMFKKTKSDIALSLKKIRDDIKAAERENKKLRDDQINLLNEDINNEKVYLQEQRQNEINKMLDRALEMLIDGSAKKMRKETAAIQARIIKLNNQADELRNKRITALDRSPNPWRQTKQKIDKKLEELAAEIQINNDRIKQLEDELIDELRAQGLQGDHAQVDFLLNSVIGDDVIQNISVFANVKSVVDQLQFLMSQNTSNLKLNRRYLGMYIVLNDVIIHVERGMIKKIDNEYMPRLEEILEKTEASRALAAENRMSKYKSIEQQKQLEILLAKTDKTIEAGRLYLKLLEDQRKEAEHQIDIFTDNRALADLAYNVEQNALGMIELVHSGFLHFDSLKTIAMPQLQIFDDDATKLELNEINKRLKAELRM